MTCQANSKTLARTAGQIKSQLDCEDMEAWKLSVMKARPSYPHKELLSVVARGLALMNGGSTANNERTLLSMSRATPEVQQGPPQKRLA